ALAVQDGIHLPSAGARQRQGLRRVARVMRPANDVLASQITVAQALQQVRSSALQSWLVVGRRGADQRGVIGVVNRSTLEREVAEHSARQLAEIIQEQTFPHVHQDQGLDLALERMGANQIDVLPVVSRADVHQLEGIVTLRDVLDSYGVGQGGRG
ncbi:MAG TPA: CBS domain-containing protein, partial [Terracidiphilus sp.]|nr:CBS domain-containing protein [Terracidiphilus sp.]